MVRVRVRIVRVRVRRVRVRIRAPVVGEESLGVHRRGVFSAELHAQGTELPGVEAPVAVHIEGVEHFEEAVDAVRVQNVLRL